MALSRKAQKAMNRDYEVTEEQLDNILKAAVVSLRYVAKLTLRRDLNQKVHKAITLLTETN